jgi:hypothetical protein
MEGVKGLPRVHAEDLQLWDPRRGLVCGYLNKKAGITSTFSKGKWQKRWFAFKTQISAHENYSLAYFHAPDDRNPRQVFALEGARLESQSGNSFELFCLDGSHIALSVDLPEQLPIWLDTMHEVIDIATARGKVQRIRRGLKPLETQETLESNAYGASGEFSPASSPGKLSQPISPIERMQYSSKTLGVSNAYQLARKKNSPQIRLDIDISTIPPGSTERHQFEEMLVSDIHRILQVAHKV